jgi:ankyrin repeat protein
MLIRQARHVIFEGDLLQSSTTTLKPLDQLFQDIYDTIFADDLQKSRTCQTALIVFRWLLCAQAVIPAEELVRAIAVYLEKGSIGLDTQSTNLTLSMVLDSCHDLVVVDKDTKDIRFIHTAVRDFLERKDHLQPTKQHAAVAELCLATVKNLALAPPPMDSVTHRDSFYYYVVLYWASHVSQVDQQHRTNSIRDSLDDLCQERPWFQSWLPQIKPASSIALKWNDPHKDKIMQALSSPATSFFTACAFGFTEVVNSCIWSRKELIRQTNDMGATGLHLAAEYGYLRIAEALCVAGADVQCLDNDGETPLVRAAAGGYKALVTMLLKAGASQQTHGRRYGTAMHGAALHGHLEVVEILLEHDGDVMASAGQFGTALQAACLRGHVKVVNLLLDAGADVNATGVVSDNKPHVQTVSGSAAAANILVIIEGELERRGLESRQNTSVSQKPPSPRARKEQTLQLLLDQKVDVNILAEGFGPPLHTAARAGHDAVVNRLLRHPDVFVDLEGGEYGSALQAAAISGSLSVVQGLLNAKADPNMQAGQYGTALIAAYRQANIGLVELLLQSGAAVNIQAGVYGTALQAGCRGGNHLLVRRLLESGADVNLTGGDYCTALQAAARDGYEKIVQLLLEHGADVNVKGGTFGSALQAAAVGGHQQVVEILFQAGAEVGDSLQSACLGGHQQLAEFFLARGSKLNSYGNNSTTALQAALAGQHKSLAQWLLEKGANAVGSRGKLGTALQLAAGLGDLDLVQVCIRRGAEPMQINRDLNVETIRQLGFNLPASIKAMHSSAIVFAAAGGHSRVVEFLLTSEGGHNLPHALRAAVEAGQESIVNLLLSCNVPVDLETLMFAFVKSSPGLVASLLERKGRDASEMDKQLKTTYGLPTDASQEKSIFNFTDLETSIYNGSQEVVKRLFDYGANLTIDNEILFFAAVAGGNSHIVRALLDRKVNVDFEHITHGTALQLAVYLGIETIVTVLLEQGANVNIVAGKYGTAVQAAAAGGHETIVKQLISAGANVHSQGGRPYNWEGRETKSKWQRKGSIASTEEYKRLTEVFYVMDTIEPRREQSGVYGTALQAAAVSGNVNIVEMLVEAGADINDIDQLGLRPLHHAAFHGHKAVVDFLLTKGASGGALDYKGRSPMLLAASRGHTETFACLFKSSTESSPSPTFIWQQLLHTASRYGHIGIIEPLIARRSNPEQPDARGQTPLLIASSNGRCSAVRFLIKKGSDINHRDLKQRSALYLAAASGHDDVVRLLLTYKTDSLALDIEGRSALHSAALGGHTKVVYLLAEQKDLLDLEDKKRLTALYLAVQSKSRESVAILLSRGANPNPHTMPRPLDLLEQPPSKDDPLRDLLLQHGATGITSHVDDIRINLDDLGLEYESASSTDYYTHSTSEGPIDEDDDERHEERKSSIRIHSGRWHNVEERNNKIQSGRWVDDEEEESNDSRYTRRRGEQRETKRWYVENSDDISDTDTSDATTSHESYRMKRGGNNRNGSGGDKKNNENTNDGEGGDDKMNDRQGFKDILVFMKWWIIMTMVMLTAILALMMVVMAMMVISMMWTMFMKIQG